MNLDEKTTKELLAHNVSNLTSEKAFEREHGGIDRMTLASAVVSKGMLMVTYNVFPTYPDQQSSSYDSSGYSFSSRYYSSQVAYIPWDIDPTTWNRLKQNERHNVLQDLFVNADVKVNCSCPAFRLQGHHEKLTREGDALYPYSGPRGTGVWKTRHGNHEGICKHLYLILSKLQNKDLGLVARKITFSS